VKYLILLLLCATALAEDVMPHADENEQLYRCLVPGVGFNRKLGGMYQKVLPPKELIKTKQDLELYYQKQLKELELEHKRVIQERDDADAREEAKNKRTAMKWGNICLFGGLALFIVGILMAVVLKQYKLELIGNIMWPVGVAATAVGAVWIGAVKHYNATVYSVIVIVVLSVIAILVNGKGVELPWNREKDLQEHE